MTKADPPYCILLVEDDPHTLELLVFTLGEAGHRIIAAENAREAQEYMEQENIDLIISDVMMPGLDGFEFRDLLLNDSQFRDIPFIFLTARSGSNDQIRGIQSGADEYITKPFEVDVLLARVQAVLARREHFARQASEDPLLPGLLNRQALERAVSRELNRIRRYPSSASLVFLDIDDFKAINDTLGHAKGDEVLVSLADVLKEYSRAVDIVGRYGGEEFIVFFPETSESMAQTVTNRMMSHFSSIKFESIEAPMTFSAGLVEAPRDGETFVTLRDRADAAMYHAKRHGKAKVVTWRPEFEESPEPTRS